MDAKIVHINFKLLFSDYISTDVIHEYLECGWCITEAKGHYCGFKEPEGSDECSFPLICLTELNVVIPPMDIKLGKEGRVIHVINEFRDKW